MVSYKSESSLKILNLDSALEELSDDAATAIVGGRMKLEEKTQTCILTTPDGDPVDVYVDGVRVNSVRTGYASCFYSQYTTQNIVKTHLKSG